MASTTPDDKADRVRQLLTSYYGALAEQQDDDGDQSLHSAEPQSWGAPATTGGRANGAASSPGQKHHQQQGVHISPLAANGALFDSGSSNGGGSTPLGAGNIDSPGFSAERHAARVLRNDSLAQLLNDYAQVRAYRSDCVCVC